MTVTTPRLSGRDANVPQYCDACFTGEYPIPLTDCDAGRAEVSHLAEHRAS